MIDISADLDELGSAIEEDKQKAATQALGGDKPAQDDGSIGSLLFKFSKNLPQNIGAGLLDAAIQMYDTAGMAVPGSAQIYNEINKKQQKANLTPHQRRMGGAEIIDSDPVREAAVAFRNWLSVKNENTADSTTRSASQFLIPFLGWSKALKFAKAPTMLGKVAGAAAAEGATLATAFDPHEARLADLIAFGKQTEGKFADALNAVSPDGSAINAYIDYMTDRENESEAEGRFKNVVDGLTGSAVVAGLFKTAATTFKGARISLENVVPSSGGYGIPNQEGKIVFHGSPHNFDEFSLDAIGTGEGAQVYGYGLYFAENPGVAKSYRTAGGPYLISDGQKVFAEEWDGMPVQGAVKDLLLEGYRQGLGADGIRMFAEREIKKNPKKWGLNSMDEQFKALDLARKTEVNQGTLYEVDIPDSTIEKMLDFDTELSKQPHILERLPAKDRQALEEMLEDYGQTPDIEAYTGNQLQQMVGRAIKEDRIVFTPKDGNFDNQNKLAAEYLLSRGIPGIRYLDRGSRKSGDGTRNIVLFDDKEAKVIKKDGKFVGTDRREDRNRRVRAIAETAPKEGIAVRQTGEKEWTIFENRKPIASYDNPKTAEEDAAALTKENTSA